MPAAKPKLRVVAGATATDVKNLQRDVMLESTNLSVAVDRCKADLPKELVDAWYPLAGRCLAFVSGGVGPIDSNFDLGNALLAELAQWRANLTAQGCKVETLKQVPAPEPRRGSFFEGLGLLFDGMSPVSKLLLLAVAFYAFKNLKP